MIFIVGNSRSGTTMLGRMLGAHSCVYTFEELHFFEQMVDASELQSGGHWPRNRLQGMVERLLTSARINIFAKVTPGRYSDEASHILDAAGSDDPVDVYTAVLAKLTRDHGKSIPCEQTPRYLFMTEELLDRYPQARFICMVRDPRDVLLSQKNKWRRRQIGAENMPLFWSIRAWLNYHPYPTTLLWVAANRRARQFAANPRFCTVQFETLARGPEATMRDLCVFLGLPFEPQMLDVTQIGSSTGEDRPDVRGVDASRMGKWRDGGLSKSEIALCDRTAGPELTAWGYDPTGLSNGPLRHALLMIGFVFKTGTAVLLNLPRNRNLIQSIRRRLS